MDSPMGIPTEGYNSPQALAESIAKRYVQIKKALPQSDQNELFEFILDNRYKLLGNVVPNSIRKENIDKSSGSLSLLTLNTIMSETEAAKEILMRDRNQLRGIMEVIYNQIQLNTENSESLTMEEVLSKAEDLTQ